MEGTVFLKRIKGIDQNSRVMSALVDRGEAFRPGAAFPAAVFEFLDESRAALTTHRARKHTLNNVPEILVVKPGVFEMETPASRDSGGGNEEERDVVGAETSQVGESSVGKKLIPINVNKVSI